MYRFEDPIYFVILPILIYLFFFKKFKLKGIEVPSLKGLNRKKQKVNTKLKLGKILMFLSLILITLALSRPQRVKEKSEDSRDGIDISIALDMSGSMMKDDLQPNRLESAKSVLITFVEQRKSDRIAISVFGEDAFTLIPLTNDQEMVVEAIKKLEIGLTKSRKTAIGKGLGVALNKIKNSTGKSKIVLLLSDGKETEGNKMIRGRAMAKVAQKLNIKIYTVGIGARYVKHPRYTNIKNTSLDEELLKDIAKITNGRYFRATDTKSLESVIKEINKIEKVKKIKKEYINKKEINEPFIILALLLLLLGVILDYKYMKIS